MIFLKKLFSRGGQQMFYVESTKGIYNILSNLYLDSQSNIKSVNMKRVNEWIKLNYNIEFQKFISCIIKIKHPLSLDFVDKENNYFHNITFYDIAKYYEKINSINSDKIKESYKDTFDQLNKYIKNILQLDSRKFESIETYINSRDSIMYLSDIDNLDKDIELVKKTNIFTNDELSKLYSITLRLVIPKYLADKINVANKMVFVYKSYLDDISFTQTNNSYTKKTINEYFSFIGNNYSYLGKNYEEYLPNTTNYKVYLNVTFDELSNIINTLAPLEYDYDSQVIGPIYYHLINFKNIKSLFKLNPGIEEGIVQRLYTRKGN